MHSAQSHGTLPARCGPINEPGRAGGYRTLPAVSTTRREGRYGRSPVEAANKGRLLRCSALRLGAPQMLVEPRHDLDEISRPIAIVELMHQDFVPGVPAGSRRPRKAENIRGSGDASGG